MNDTGKPDIEKTEEAVEFEYLDESIEFGSDEFYAALTWPNDKVTNEMLLKTGLRISDDGRWKYMRPIFTAQVKDTLQAWHDRLITKEQMREYIGGLGSGKVTRYKIETDLLKIRRAAKKATE